MKTNKRHVCNGMSVLGRSTLGILRKVDNTSKDTVRAVYATLPAQETRLAIGPLQQRKRPVNGACVERVVAGDRKAKRGAAPFPTGNECDRICHAPRLRIISLSIATTAYIVRSCGQRGTKPEKHRKSTLDNDRNPCRKSDEEERTAGKPYVELREHVHGAAIGTWCQKGGGGKLVAAGGVRDRHPRVTRRIPPPRQVPWWHMHPPRRRARVDRPPCTAPHGYDTRHSWRRASLARGMSPRGGQAGQRSAAPWRAAPRPPRPPQHTVVWRRAAERPPVWGPRGQRPPQARVPRAQTPYSAWWGGPPCAVRRCVAARWWRRKRGGSRTTCDCGSGRGPRRNGRAAIGGGAAEIASVAVAVGGADNFGSADVVMAAGSVGRSTETGPVWRGRRSAPPPRWAAPTARSPARTAASAGPRNASVSQRSVAGATRPRGVLGRFGRLPRLARDHPQRRVRHRRDQPGGERLRAGDVGPGDDAQRTVLRPKIGAEHAVGVVEAGLRHHVLPAWGAAQRRRHQSNDLVVEAGAPQLVQRAGGEEVAAVRVNVGAAAVARRRWRATPSHSRTVARMAAPGMAPPPAPGVGNADSHSAARWPWQAAMAACSHSESSAYMRARRAARVGRERSRCATPSPFPLSISSHDRT
ncbi:LOW QUALITY PROTEIN: hypothetical protein BU14_0106s0046, partial [Porphyra umbilicalis]